MFKHQLRCVLFSTRRPSLLRVSLWFDYFPAVVVFFGSLTFLVFNRAELQRQRHRERGDTHDDVLR